MRNKLWFLLSLIAIGIIVLAWPEANTVMLVQLSKTHGPSSIDMLGIAIIMAGYIPMVVHFVGNFRSAIEALGRHTAFVLVLIVAGSWVAIVVGLMIPSDFLLWAAVALSTVSQSILFYTAFRQRKVQR